jgi:hypothetical protein
MTKETKMKSKATKSQQTPLGMLCWLAENYTFGRNVDAALKNLTAKSDPLDNPPPDLVVDVRSYHAGIVKFADAQHGYACAIERWSGGTIVRIGCRVFKSRQAANAGWDRSGASSRSGHVRQRRHELIAWIAEVCAFRGWKW